MSAEGFLLKYGHQGPVRLVSVADRVQIPALLTFGERELDEHPAFVGLRAALDEARSAGRWPQLNIETIPNADHFYVACYRLIANVVPSGLRSMTENRSNNEARHFQTLEFSLLEPPVHRLGRELSAGQHRLFCKRFLFSWAMLPLLA